MIEVEGEEKSFKDAKLFPNGRREWDWTETSTHHSPGIQLSDIQELLDKGASTLVLSNGVLGYLKVSLETVNYLARENIPYHSMKTPEAVKLYNELCCKSESIGALIHSTC